jgi:uncharacterized membrane protein
MNRALEAIGLGSLAALFWVTCRALYGPDPLPGRIPTHFDVTGQPNSWGSPSTLMFLPVVALALYVLMTVVSRFPSAFNYPVSVTAENRPRLQALSLRMIAWLKVELVCLFMVIQFAILDAVRQGRFTLSPVLVPLFIVAVFATAVGHVVNMFHAARPESSS